LTTVYFTVQLTKNAVLQAFFDFRILTASQFRRFKKKYSFRFKQRRAQALKDREQGIEKQRDLKAQVGEGQEDD
jgi:hypothetical protein